MHNILSQNLYKKWVLFIINWKLIEQYFIVDWGVYFISLINKINIPS